MKEKIISVLVVLLVLVGVGFYLNKMPERGNGAVQTENKNVAAESRQSATLGEYLTDSKGMTLYVFADDPKLKRSCLGECAKIWPPFIYDNKDLRSFNDVLSRRMNVIFQNKEDSIIQYAYGEKPLYYYIGDKNVGETNGNGLNAGKWSIVLITK